MKTLRMVALMALVSTSAIAQAAQPKLDDTFTFTFRRSDIPNLGTAITKLPYETAVPLLNKLQEDINAQDKARGIEPAAAPTAQPETPAAPKPPPKK